MNFGSTIYILWGHHVNNHYETNQIKYDIYIFGKNLWQKSFFLNEIVNLEQCYVDLWLLNQHWQHKDSKKQHVSSKKRFHWAKENVNAADFLMMILIVNLGMWF